MENFTVLISAFVPSITTIILKIIQKRYTRIKQYKFQNLDFFLNILLYEYTGSLLVQLLSGIPAFILYQKKFSSMPISLYIVPVTVFTSIYIIVIIKLSNKMGKSIPHIQLKTSVPAFIISLMYTAEVVAPMYIANNKIKIIFYCILFFTTFIQCLLILCIKQEISIVYIIYVENTHYVTKCRPKELGTWVYIKQSNDKNNIISQIQIPKNSIIKIEHQITYITTK